MARCSSPSIRLLVLLVLVLVALPPSRPLRRRLCVLPRAVFFGETAVLAATSATSSTAFAATLLGDASLAGVPCPGNGNCSGHGQCDAEKGTCDCEKWFTGNECADFVCPRNCSAQGHCDVKSGNCSCASGFSGVDCSKELCPNDCSGHGKCDEGSHKCTCDKGFFGKDCGLCECPNNCTTKHLERRGECNTETGNCTCYHAYYGPGCVDEPREYRRESLQGVFFVSALLLCSLIVYGISMTPFHFLPDSIFISGIGAAIGFVIYLVDDSAIQRLAALGSDGRLRVLGTDGCAALSQHVN